MALSPNLQAFFNRMEAEDGIIVRGESTFTVPISAPPPHPVSMFLGTQNLDDPILKFFQTDHPKFDLDLYMQNYTGAPPFLYEHIGC